jgi:hypothetical protein
MEASLTSLLSRIASPFVHGKGDLLLSAAMAKFIAYPPIFFCRHLGT